jgi:hypothetical protein
VSNAEVGSLKNKQIMSDVLILVILYPMNALLFFIIYHPIIGLEGLMPAQ